MMRTSYKSGMYRLYRIDGFSYFEALEELPIMSLEGKEADGEWRQWMIDDPFNFLATKRYCEAMSGRVLTSGLGLGIAAKALAENDKVTELVVVEREQAVIDLVKPYMPEKAQVVQGDFSDYIAQQGRFRPKWLRLILGDGRDWDYILLDIWRTQGVGEHQKVMDAEVMPARARLKARFPKTEMVFFGFAPPTDIDIQVPYRGRTAPELVR